MPARNNPWLVFIIVFLTVTFGAMNSVLAPAYLQQILDDLFGKDLRMISEALGIKDMSAADRAYYGAWINFAFIAGATVGGIIFGFLADHIGRRKTLLAALMCFGIGSLLGAGMHDWQLLAATRFLVGVGVGNALVVSVVILSEVWPERTKAIALGVLSVAYPVGIVASGVITTNVPQWSTAFIIGAASALLVIPAWSWVRETYTTESRDMFAEKVVVTHDHRRNLFLGIVVYGTMLIGLWSAFAWLPTWVEDIAGANEKGLSKPGMAVTLLGVGGMAGSIVSGWLAKAFGSRLVQGICFIVCFLLSWWMFRMITEVSDAVFIGSALLGFFFGMSQGVLNILIPELFPAHLRSSSTGLCFHTGRAFTAAAVFFVGALAMALGGYGNAIFTFSWVYIIGLIALLFIKKPGASLQGSVDLQKNN